MNLREAVLTGRPFKRPKHKMFYVVYEGKIVHRGNITYKLKMKLTDYIAEDWLVETIEEALDE